MYTIKTLNAISPVGLAKLPANQFEIDNEAAAPHGILVRSADMHDAPLPDSLLAIARAGAGTNNIPVEECTNAGIVVFNTPGANANAVAELVIGALVAGSRNMVDAVNWAQTLKGRDTIAKDVEKGKKAFVGPELRGKTLGVIGLGAIGARVANAAVALGMEVLGYDPYISIDAAWSLSRSVQHCVTLGDMLPRCDYLKNGNITHSVNLPDVSQPRVSGRRICIIHKNAPGAISAITGILTEAHLNIENMVNKGKKDVAYTLLDVTGNVTDDLAAKLGAIEPAIRVRVL